jgi:hypothetical protein
VTQEPTTSQVLVDAFVYAPLGVVSFVAEQAPELARSSRVRFAKRLELAGMVGKFAVDGALGQLRSAGKRQGDLERPASGEPPVQDAPARDAQPTRGREKLREGPTSSKAARSGPASTTKTAVAHGPASELPIETYDALAASQVVERLASLSADELEIVRCHESANRRRRTVLHRIAQLSSARGQAAR